MALGAQSRDILHRRGARRYAVLALAGVVPGVALAYAAGRSMEALLAGVKPADARDARQRRRAVRRDDLVGSLAPTLRAMRVDPITALRAE